MSERKYTEEEIEKALECCAINCSCDGCPANYREHDDFCARYIKRLALDLINRQKAEIERLKADRYMVRFGGSLELIPRPDTDKIRAEAIKEFAARLHKGIDDFRDKREMVMLPYTESALLIIERKIDNLVAEMTEGE